MLPPFRFQPIFKQRPWGGCRLAEVWQKFDANTTRGWAESWEMADLGTDQTCVIGGPFDGTPLGTLVAEQRAELLGSDNRSGSFPMLFKFLDAGETLSVQVHPSDEQARRLNLGPRGKSEAWVVITAEPGSRLFIGLKSGIDRAALERSLADGTVADCLHEWPARPGEVFSIPAGTVHAIGAGITLAELQQPSDVTLRLFDWNRRDAKGRARDLHIAAAMQCLDFNAGPILPLVPRPLTVSSGQNLSEELIRAPHFTWRRHTLREQLVLSPTGRCRLFSLISGQAEIQSGEITEVLRPGDTRLIPAVTGRLSIQPQPGCVLLDAEP